MRSRLIYFADPMCSWCYGFGPQLSALLADDASLEPLLVMGGLRAYNTKPVDEAFKTMLRGHWAHVRELSGLPIADNIVEHEDFVYDTEPACRAVVTFRAQQPQSALDYFHALQAAFYRDGHNITQGEVLADLAATHGMAREMFIPAWQSDEAKQATRTDFETAQRLGVTGFPTLALEHEGQLQAIAAGFVSADEMRQRIAQIRAGQATD